MQRPVFKWLLFASCLAMFLAVMAWITVRTLGMERQRVAAERDAQVQEKIRLALWRMDSLASTLLIRENSRPPDHYQAFRSPDDLFSSDNKEIAKGKALMPSPLLGEPPEFVLLHFEIPERALAINSPQVPMGVQLELANNWYAISSQLRYATDRLAKLDALLKRHPEVIRGAAATLEDQVAPTSDKAREETKPEPPVAPKAVAQAPADSQATYNLREQIQRSNVVQQQIATEKLQALKAPMKKSGEGTLPLYADSLKKKTDSYLPRSSSSAAPAPPASAPKNAATKSESSAGSFAAATPAPAPAAAAKPNAAKTVTNNASRSRRGSASEPGVNTATPSPAEITAGTAGGSSSPAQMRGAGRETKQALALPELTSAPETPPAQSGELKAVWVEGELLLVRPATLDGKGRTQGVWVDWEKLRDRLLGAVTDLLPNASLSPALANAASLDPSALVTLPVKLTAGAISVAMHNGWSPLQRSLAIAWICLAIAAVATALVLHRAMLLSERRGAFVSAVTHELRTPLTTFQLYSEMLADDMVPDAAKRREYLRTLCDESTRLTHLVENVLAYSRIERGRTAARVERITVADLVARIEPRLRRRASDAGLELEIYLPADVAAQSMNVDAMGVEQILFNLVDNACKYAAPASSPRMLHVEVSANGPRIVFRVRDHGPGISRQQQRRLFQPFEKSATEAAHSAPGVGLGLALCRRLAREMGGDLVLEKKDGGACFALTLPA